MDLKIKKEKKAKKNGKSDKIPDGVFLEFLSKKINH
jgi:hypothetical protein